MSAPANETNKCKFRISISQEQMQFILSCPDCPADLRKLIELALFKASNGHIAPSHTLTAPKPKAVRDLTSEQQYKIACRYLEQGDAIPPEVLGGYNQYRYDNDLMDSEEQANYEQEALGL